MPSDAIQRIIDADEDAISFSGFMVEPSDELIPRRLAPPMNTLNYYRDFLHGLELVYSQQSGYVDVNGIKTKTVTQALDDALNAAVVGGGGLADTAVATVPQLTGQVSRTQSSKNTDNISIKDFKSTSSTDDAALKKAITVSNKVSVNTSTSDIDQLLVTAPLTLDGSALLTQSKINKHTISVSYPLGSAGDLDGSYIEGAKFQGLNFGLMGTATTDDFAALSFAASDGGISAFNNYSGVENGIRISTTGVNYGVAGKGARDTLVVGDRFVNPRRFCVQILQGNYSRVLGVVKHSNGVNYVSGTTGGTNNGGTGGGIRLAGISKGNIVVGSNIRDTNISVWHQKGSEFNVLSGNYYENSTDNTISTTIESNGKAQGNVHNGFIIKDAGAAGIRTAGAAAQRYSGSVFGAGKRGTGGGNGISSGSVDTDNKLYRIGFKDGSGLVPAVGTTISQGSTTAVIVGVDGADIQPVSSGVAMPVAGDILVKELTGGFFIAGALTGITATATRTYAVDGRHRIDLTVADTTHSQLQSRSDCNLTDVISMGGSVEAANIYDNHSNVRIIISDNSASTAVYIWGDNNIVEITDNSLTARASVSIRGTGNIVTVTSKNGQAYITGSNNTLIANVNRIGVSGDDNTVEGRCTQFSKGGNNNDYARLNKATLRAEITATTTAAGDFIVTHGLLTRAVIATAQVIGETPYFVTTASAGYTSGSTRYRVFNINGTPLVSSSVTLSVYIAI